MNSITIRGAIKNNLKNINISIPKNRITTITGVSGSGKSSLAFDIIFEEGKNLYLSSIGVFTDISSAKNCESIEGLGPTVAVRQNTIRQSNPRSTLGTRTGILNHLAFLFAAEAGFATGDKYSPSDFLYTTSEGMCMLCQGKGSINEIDVDALIPDKRLSVKEIFIQNGISKGFLSVLQRRYGDTMLCEFGDLPEELQEEFVYGRYEKGRQSFCLERILKMQMDKGIEVSAYYHSAICPRCSGARVSKRAQQFRIAGLNIGEAAALTLDDCVDYLCGAQKVMTSEFGKNTCGKIVDMCKNLSEFRLGHLSLYREMSTLSGGELQRVFLNLHINSGLENLIYVFDEPLSALHPAEKLSIIEALKRLKDMGNTVIVVEHDEVMAMHSDYIIEIGPLAGVLGGEVVFEGDYEAYRKQCFKPVFKANKVRMVTENNKLVVTEARANNLKNLTVEFPLSMLVGVAGMSGSGKTTLVKDVLAARLEAAFIRPDTPGIRGAEKISGCIHINQEPIGRNMGSTPASYMGVWDDIRKLFAVTDDAVRKGMDAGDFSFNSKGACEECKGNGVNRIYLTTEFYVDSLCNCCKGKKYNEESLSVKYRSKNIYEVLQMSVMEAMDFFSEKPVIYDKLSLLGDMGLSYLKLGQSTQTLSGGEAQRIKLAKQLAKRVKEGTLYIMDEPTAGLSEKDIELLLKILRRIVEEGNSIILIEHNISVLSACDYIIEMGRLGGAMGGEVIACGSPLELRNNKESIIGSFLEV